MVCSSARPSGSRRCAAWVLVVAAVGCAEGDSSTASSGLTFGDPTAPMTSPAPSASGDAGSGGDADTETPGSGSGDAGDSGDGEASTGTGPAAADDPQPDNGMYSDCLSTAECVGVNTCVTIFDMAGDPFDGFCTLDNCQDPVADCAPSPGGDAVPTCVDIMLNGSPATACALDCEGGKVCPQGMKCYEDDGIPVCA